MAEETSQDKRVEQLKQRLGDELVDDEGQSAPSDEVNQVVDAKVGALADAPVQDFVPLLIEHDARDELRRHGLHRNFTDASSGNDSEREPADPTVGELEAEDWPEDVDTR